MSSSSGGYEGLPATPPAAELTLQGSDPELGALANTAVQAIGPDHFHDLLVKYERFDHSSTDFNSGVVVKTHHTLRQLLVQLPGYIENATATGIDENRAYGLVQAIIGEEKRSKWSGADDPVVQLGRAFAWQAEHHGVVSDEDYTALHNLVAETAASPDTGDTAINAYRALSRLGLTTAQSIEVIKDSLPHYEIATFAVGVFDALSVARVDAAVIKGICGSLFEAHQEDNTPYGIQADYVLLRELIARVCPGADIEPNTFLRQVYDHLSRGKSMTDIAQEYAGTDARTIEGLEAQIYDPQDRIEKHFLPKSGGLELAILPYRTERSLEEGLGDLKSIARERGRYRETLGEGLWVFDSTASAPTWYSLGGRTELHDGRVRHVHPEYPINEISQRPFLFHCHPMGLEKSVGPDPRDELFPEAALPIVNRFLAVTPSRRDYEMVAELLRTPTHQKPAVRSFIAHGSGLTEYTFPNDADALTEMSQHSQAIRDDVLQNVDWERILFDKKWLGLVRIERDKNSVVQELVQRLNDKLPEGFQLRLTLEDQ